MENKLPQRKNLRLKSFDYSNLGSYFITICTKEKQKIFSKIENGEDGFPSIVLNEIGKIIEDIINNLPVHLNVDVDDYIIMPNHVHMVIILNDVKKNEKEKRSVVSKVVGFIKMQSSKRIHEKNQNMQIWQRNYNDHIIRDRKDYENIKNYMYCNPLRWKNNKKI